MTLTGCECLPLVCRREGVIWPSACLLCRRNGSCYRLSDHLGLRGLDWHYVGVTADPERIACGAVADLIHAHVVWAGRDEAARPHQLVHEPQLIQRFRRSVADRFNDLVRSGRGLLMQALQVPDAEANAAYRRRLQLDRHLRLVAIIVRAGDLERIPVLTTYTERFPFAGCGHRIVWPRASGTFRCSNGCERHKDTEHRCRTPQPLHILAEHLAPPSVAFRHFRNGTGHPPRLPEYGVTLSQIGWIGGLVRATSLSKRDRLADLDILCCVTERLAHCGLGLFAAVMRRESDKLQLQPF